LKETCIDDLSVQIVNISGFIQTGIKGSRPNLVDVHDEDYTVLYRNGKNYQTFKTLHINGYFIIRPLFFEIPESETRPILKHTPVLVNTGHRGHLSLSSVLPSLLSPCSTGRGFPVNLQRSLIVTRCTIATHKQSHFSMQVVNFVTVTNIRWAQLRITFPCEKRIARESPKYSI
jgi:hypothetical protein